MVQWRPMTHATAGAEREQRALENLDAWARRGDAWVRQVVAILTKKLLDQNRA